MSQLIIVSCACGTPTEIPAQELTLIQLHDTRKAVVYFGYAHQCYACGLRSTIYKETLHENCLLFGLTPAWFDRAAKAGAEQTHIVRPIPHNYHYEPLTQQEIEEWICDLPTLNLHQYFGISEV